MFATTIGLRGKAMATAVPSSIRVEAPAATASARKGSWRFSIVSAPSKPAASAAAAAAGTSFRSFWGRVVRMRMDVRALFVFVGDAGSAGAHAGADPFGPIGARGKGAAGPGPR